jgi:rod shape determining protein RodA
VLADWQKNRIYSFLGIQTEGMTDQQAADNARQATQAKIAIGSGQVSGKGMFSMGGESRLSHIAEKHTDFIFASTAEAVGFIGAMIIILLYFTLIIRTLWLATKAKDDFGALICVGVFAMTLFHIFENIGMNIGVMPITGIPLPFFSYGGSNLLTNMIAFGLVINVSMRRQRWSFS